MIFDILDPGIISVLKRMNFQEPTNPQKDAIKDIIQKKNVLLVAPTGSGKTEAALLPIFDLLLKNPKRIFCLYITPLKALNRDLLDRLEIWSDSLEIDVEVRHGDTSSYVRSQQAKDPPHILITTPETFQSILVGKKMREHLKNVQFVVIDEIHELAEEKRGIQLFIGLERLKKLIGRDFCRIGLSATVGNKEKIAEVLQGSSNKVEIIESKVPRGMKISVEYPKPKEEDFKLSEKIYTSPEAYARIKRIIELYKAKRGVLIFVNTRETAEILSSRLKSLEEKIGVHHSSLSKDSRLKAEKDFKEKTLDGLVCTSSLGLGIDIGHIDAVIQYMSPRRIDMLLQRVGRSGHRAGGTSEGYILVTDVDDAIEGAVIAKLALAGVLEPVKIPANSFDVLAHQIVGLTFDERIDVKKAFEIVKNSVPFKKLEFEEFMGVVDILTSLWLLRRYDDVLGLTKGSFEYYFSNLSMIPDTKNFDVINITMREKIAKIDEEFAAELDVGDAFIARGSCWKVVSKEEDRIMVESIKFAANAPEWTGELLPVEFVVAKEVGNLKKILWSKSREEGTKYLKENYPVDENLSLEIIDDIKQLKSQPSPEKIVIECIENYIVIHAHFGNKVNETLGRVLASYLTLKYGNSVGLKTDQYRIMLQIPGKASAEFVKEALEKMDPQFMESTLETVLKHSQLFKHRFLHVARRFGIVSRDAKFTKFGLKKLVDVYEMTPVFRETIKEIFNDKMDLENALEIIKGIKSGSVVVEISGSQSDFALRFMKQYAPEIVASEKPKKEIIRLVRERLEGRKLDLICLYCKQWYMTLTVRNSEVSCQVCGSKLLGMGTREDLKLFKKKEHDAQEKHKLWRIRKSADLYLTYGKKAFVCLAGYGIGPDTAARILVKAQNDDELIEKIIEAEKQYARTRVYWDIKPGK